MQTPEESSKQKDMFLAETEPSRPNRPKKPIHLLVVGPGMQIPSFKNEKRAGINRYTGKLMSYTDKDVKARMLRLETAMLFALYSACQTGGNMMDSECRKQLRIALSELSDDSITEIPEFSFGVKRVPKGQEGVEIIITPL